MGNGELLVIISGFSGIGRSELKDTFRPIPEQIRRELGLLDGKEKVAYLIYYVPDEAGWPDAPGFDESKYDDEYLQSAGNAQRMVIEVRRLEDDGQYHQYAVGRAEPDDSNELVEVHYSSYTLTVPRSEVFTADEATPIYYQYFQTQTLAEDLSLRELGLS